MQNLMMMFTFSVFDQKNPFCANLVPRLIRICRIHCCCSLFYFRPETTFFGKFGPKIENYQFKLKFGTYTTNSNIQNSLVLLTFPFSNGMLFFGKFGPKTQNCQFKLKFGTQSNTNMQNSVFTFSVFVWKLAFLANLVQKMKFSVRAEIWYLD